MKNSGVKIFSPWYTEDFVQEKLKHKQSELARLESIGDIRSASDWNSRAKRKFEGYFSRLSDDTKKTYQSSARNFGKYLGLRRSESQVSNIVARLIVLSYMDATTLVEEYIMWMEDEELSPNTIRTRLAALRWFVDACRRVGWVEYKLDVKGVKGGNVTDTEGPSVSEFRRILRVVQTAQGKTAARDKLIVYMLAFMGLRISSVISLDMDNVDFGSERIKVKWKGEGDSVAQYVWRPVGPETMDALEEWIEIRGTQNGPVFKSLNNSKRGSGRLSVRQAQRQINEIGVAAITRKKLSPHSFRHFHATDNLEATDGNTRKVMKSTRHKSIKTIEHYDDDRNDDAREITSSMEERWLGCLEDHADEDEAEIEERYNSHEDEDKDESEEEDDEFDDDDFDDIVSAVDAANEVEMYERIPTGIDGLNELLGGDEGTSNWGIVPGSIVLLAGSPGIGKSTLARQMSFNIVKANPGVKVLYASAEESVSQISGGLERIEASHPSLLLMSERSINRILRAGKRKKVSVIIVDSVSTVKEVTCNKKPGSVTQVKAVGQYVMDWCKGTDEQKRNGKNAGSGIAVVFISHVTSSGDIAGPKTLEHVVDAVYTFTSPSKRSPMRSLGCEGKNRFGDATKEMKFKMTDKGLVETENTSRDEGWD